jgi:hypothetical protein
MNLGQVQEECSYTSSPPVLSRALAQCSSFKLLRSSTAISQSCLDIQSRGVTRGEVRTGEWIY